MVVYLSLMLKVDVLSVTEDNREGVLPDSWLRNSFDQRLLKTDFSRKILKEISKCEVVDENVLISEVLGGVSPEWMGTGCKFLLLIAYEEDPDHRIANLHWMGENVYKYIMEACEISGKDFTIITDEVFSCYPTNDKYPDNPVYVINSDKYVYSNTELIEEIAVLRGLLSV